MFNTDFPGKTVDYCGFEAYEFTLDGLVCHLVKPSVPADEKKNWFWRVHFYGAFPDADIALLKKGWHVAHIEVYELYGNDECMRRMDMLYDFMVSMGFCRKCVPVGYSRGGLDVHRWATLNPEKVSCIYLDNPVCDFKSWPGGKGAVDVYEPQWQTCKDVWGFDEEAAMAFKGNPIDTLDVIAEKKIPVLIVCGDADTTVPAEENSVIYEKRCREAGGNIEVIWKKGFDHHPHCLSDPSPIVEFVEKYS